MPPALHPKSFTTASLFTTTAVFAFLVVGAPHILPCPAPKRSFAEDDQERNGKGDTGGEKKKKKKCPVPRLGGGKEVGRVKVEVEVQGEGR
ncbi:hypothetical protein K440DRAFT_632410 [Wilcoxina mikolae CBS 423.85]|nr:hypothetical protein K440DRAFT_632410 [Wilcoxina mikolae CBS 423.85]